MDHPMLGVESIVNLLCLLFQYDFADSYYYRYCNRMDLCCRWSMTWRLGKHDEAVKAKRAVMHLRGASTLDGKNGNAARELESYMVNDTVTSSQQSLDIDSIQTDSR